MKNDLRQHQYFRVAVITPRVSLANPIENAKNHLEMIINAYQEGAMYILGPELGLTGYTASDLFQQSALLESTLDALKFLLTKTKKYNTLITIGLPLIFQESLYNCSITFHQGKIISVTPKTYPPEYREFYELRHFARSVETNLKTISLLGQQVPFGTDIIIKESSHSLFNLNIEICEDGWVPVSPSSLAALNGATVLANLSASNITIGKSAYREDLVKSHSAKSLCAYLYSASGFGESTTDLAWDGDGYIAQRGEILKKTIRFNLKPSFIIDDLDLGAIVHDRLSQSSFHQNRQDNLKDYRFINLECKLGNPKANYQSLLSLPDCNPFVPSDKDSLHQRTEEVFMIQSFSLAQRLSYLDPSMQKIFLGLSGGLDSTLSLLVAIKAFNILGLDLKYIHCLTMPGFGTTNRTKNNAVKLAEATGVSIEKISIKNLTKLALNSTKGKLDNSVAFENAQAWARMYTLFLSSAVNKGIVLGTGDLTELILGWCTLFADQASHYNVNSGVPKTLVRHQISFASKHLFDASSKAVKILNDILDTPISPELQFAKDGLIVQETEKIIGPYELHDFFAYHLIRFGKKPSTVHFLATQVFMDKYQAAEVTKWLKLFITRFFRNQFKRSVLPDGPKVGLLAISPRGDWRMPSDAKEDIWLNELDDYLTNINDNVK